MHRIKGQKIYVFLLLLVWLGFIIGSNFKWLHPQRWWGQTLVVLMNENEARPCGGFVTAYGVVNLPFGGVSLNNSFDFPPVNLGLNSQPLSQVSREKKFWDLGASANLNVCGQEFVSAYERATGNFPDQVILLQSGVIEDYLTALGGVTVADLTLTGQNFFALTSRLVADIDRHDETALAERKNPLHTFGKKIMVTSVLRPWRWGALSNVIKTAEEQGTLYFHQPGVDRVPLWQANEDRTLRVAEWNLGGGKSSRYLDKEWTVFLKQVTPEQWQLENKLSVTHLGQEDKPLSQTWRGGFEIKVFDQPTRFIAATIEPGDTYSHTERFTVASDKLFNFMQTLYPTQARFNLYAPPYQDWAAQLQVSALAQQSLQSVTGNLEVQEYSGAWSGQPSFAGQPFSLSLLPDEAAPFLTWHKPLLDPSEAVTQQLALTEGDVVVELHFNEPVTIQNAPFETLPDARKRFAGTDLNISLKDRDYEVDSITADLGVERALLFADQTTLLLKVRPEPYQLNERYYLEIRDVADRWGNAKVITNRTVITR